MDEHVSGYLTFCVVFYGEVASGDQDVFTTIEKTRH